MIAPVVFASSDEGVTRLREVLAPFSPGTGLSIVIVQHLTSGADRLLARSLASQVPLPVRLAESGERCAPDTILVAPGDAELGFSVGTRPTIELAPGSGPRLDYTLTALADLCGPASRVVLCCGPADDDDGAKGCTRVREVGGRVIVPGVMPPEELERALRFASDPGAVAAPEQLPRLLAMPSGSPSSTAPGPAAGDQGPGAAPPRLLVVDDEAIARRVFARLGDQLHWEIEVTSTAEEALTRLRTATYDLLVTDLVMPGMDGIELAREAHAQCPTLPIVVVSGFVDPQAEKALWEIPVADIVPKPYRIRELEASLRKVLAAS